MNANAPKVTVEPLMHVADCLVSDVLHGAGGCHGLFEDLDIIRVRSLQVSMLNWVSEKLAENVCCGEYLVRRYRVGQH